MLIQKLKKRVTISRTLTGVVMGVLGKATILYGGFTFTPVLHLLLRTQS